MPTDYRTWTTNLTRFDRALAVLAPVAQALGVAAPTHEEWFELLHNKLLPQATAQPLLVVAVVGGTNLGKSLLFNQLAGENASAVSPLAAGTKHPVLLVPAGFTDEATLDSLFTGFTLRRWQTAEAALEASSEDLLFWREGNRVPPRLLLLDTPDIDSDAEVNWRRADAIRQSADVLVAVLTQQKYNDAAVKQFFRRAAAADKVVMVVFNQCDLEGDADYWPQWLDTFAGETGVVPELVYVVPRDRRAAAALELPFFLVGTDGRSAPTKADLRADLAALRFDAIKIRTFRGALTAVLDPQRGAPAYLTRIEIAAGEFALAAAALSATEMARVNWPTVPSGLLVEEITSWWDERRSKWSRAIHGFYRGVGQAIARPVRAAWRNLNGATTDPLEQFRTAERVAVLEAVEKLLGELERLAAVGNDILRPRLQSLLNGRARARLLERVEQAHAKLPVLDDDYRTFLRGELDTWVEENPRAVWWLRSFDHVAAIARPALTVTLAVSGGILAGDVVHHAAVQAAGHTASQLAAEAAITGSVTAGGEAMVGAASEGLKQAATRLFYRLQSRYAELRASWLAEWLERELLGDLLAEFRRGAGVPHSPAFVEAQTLLTLLRTTV